MMIVRERGQQQLMPCGPSSRLKTMSNYTKRLGASHSSSANCQTEIISRSANSCTKPGERANRFWEIERDARSQCRVPHPLSQHSLYCLSLWPKIILYKWMDFFDFHMKFGTKNCIAIVNLNLKYLEQYIFFNVSLCRVVGDSLCFIEPERRRTRNVKLAANHALIDTLSQCILHRKKEHQIMLVQHPSLHTTYWEIFTSMTNTIAETT